LTARRGFSLIEIIAAAVLVALLAALTIPTVMSRLAVGKGTALANEIQSLGTALRAFNDNTGSYPKFLDELVSLSTHTDNTCGGNMTAAQQAKWKGPYVNRLIAGDYVTADDNTIVYTLTRVAGPPAYLQLTINNVSSDVAAVVEEAIDGPVVATSYTTGSFLWVSGTKVATYRLVVPTTCT
jgi:prepilin-type N-terminal cleavage/methylation domain-containing protein